MLSGALDDALLAHVQALKLSEEEALAAFATTDAGAIRERCGVPEILVTFGFRGAEIACDGPSGHVSAEAVTDIDPTGAGDAFLASYAHARAQRRGAARRRPLRLRARQRAVRGPPRRPESAPACGRLGLRRRRRRLGPSTGKGELCRPHTDSELKARHRAMWASGDYPSMVETFLLPIGPRLVDACGIGPGMRVLDVAAGTGNASIPAAERGAQRHRQRPDAGAARGGPPDAPRRQGVELEWVEADAEHLPFDDASFDVVMSAIGAMFAPHHQEVADELVRVCRPGGTIGLLSWTPEGMIGALFRAHGAVRAGAAAGAQPPPLWGSEEHVRGLFGDRVDWRAHEKEMLDITAFERPNDYGEHFKDLYGPTITVRGNAVRNDRAEEFDDALRQFCDEWNLGTPERARFEQEYLVSVGTRA